jgi:glycolate oxidase FAD binding subunit
VNSLAPSSIPEVVSLIEEARQDKSPLWFTGSGTAQVPDGHTVVSTRGLSGVVDYRPDDLTIVVRSGTTLAQLEETLREHGHTAVLPETSPQRTVGGVVASGASGYRRLRYGPTRDRVIGTTIVTGYGEVVHAGGQLVKNVTGYDIPRLLTGSCGALGFIAEVSLKLWPDPHSPKTLRVADPDVVRRQMYQPTAALETENGGFVYVSDTVISEGSAVNSYTWPDPLDEPIAAALNVPARYVIEAVGRVRDLGVARFVAQHGVGVVDASWKEVDEAQLGDLRRWAEWVGGSLVIRRSGPLSGSLSTWGGDPSTLAIERRLKDLFDPDRVCNPGVLAGGV